MIKVARVLADTVASELGIVPGTALQSVNGRKLEDFLDWEFLTAEDELVLEVTTPEGEALVFEIERPEGMAMGIVLEPPSRSTLRQQVRVLLHRGAAQGTARAALRARR